MSRGAAADRSRLGTLEALAAACMWGTSGVFAVRLFELGVPPETVALIRPLIGVTVLAVALLLVKPRLLHAPLRAFGVIGLWGGLSLAVFQIAYQKSLDASGVPTTVALLYLAPAVVAVASGPLLGEWPSRRQITLVAVTLLGVWLTVLGAQEVEPRFGGPGIAWGLLSAASYAAYTLYGRFAARRFGSVSAVVYGTAAACGILAVVLPVTSGPLILPTSGQAWILLAAFALVTISLGTFLFFDALGRVEASRAAVVTAAEPVVAALLATTLLGQGLSPLGWLGIVLVVVGVAGVGLAPDRGASRS